MAKVAAESLPWLSNPSTGWDIFAKQPRPPLSPPSSTDAVPKRLVATRQSEIFVGRGSEVRSADLQDLKARHPKVKVVAEDAKKFGHREYKVLGGIPIDYDIQQLEISPDGLYLAIAGETELAVCVLPGTGFLKRSEKPQVPHFQRVGRAYHNPDAGANIIRVLWHPLGYAEASLLVLTADGYLRMYYFETTKNVSFEVPDYTFDLYALSGRKRHIGGFTADQDEMIPASMCFGSGNQGWAPLTVYIVMRGGDLYGLSPVVPSHWMVDRDYLQRLSLDITADLESIDDATTPEQRNCIRRQTKWINHVLDQEAGIMREAQGLSTTPRNPKTWLERPNVLGEPVLQGPFLFQPAPIELATDDCYAACDILHVENGDVGILGILYSNGRVDICLEFERLGAKFLDKKRKYKPPESIPQSDLPVIASYETVDLGIWDGNDSEFTSWPTLVRDACSNQLWFVNHNRGVVAFSMNPWLGELETLMEDEEDVYLESKLKTCQRSSIQTMVTSKLPIDGGAVLVEAYIGYILVASYEGGVASIEYDEPAEDLSDDDESFVLRSQPRPTSSATASTPRPASRWQSDTETAPRPRAPSLTQTNQPLLLPPSQPGISALLPRFELPAAFSARSRLHELLLLTKRENPKVVSSPFLFSSESNRLLRMARNQLKHEYTDIMLAAQDTHDRAAAQRLEYQKQLKTLHSVNERLKALQTAEGIAGRLERFVRKQEEMQAQADEILKTLIVKSETGLSDAEKKWFAEAGKVEARTEVYAKRKEELRELVEVVQENEKAEQEEEGSAGGDGVSDGVSEKVRAGSHEGLFKMLDREALLVARTRRRLEALEIETVKALVG